MLPDDLIYSARKSRAHPVQERYSISRAGPEHVQSMMRLLPFEFDRVRSTYLWRCVEAVHGGY
jgi:hypothetical protein